jgi:ubiquinone/menaquinone biosynthesis C-methylase UbiE
MLMKYIKSFIVEKTTNEKWLMLLIVIGILILVMMFFRDEHHTEGFEQQENFVLKQADEVYDDFYSQMYDSIMDCGERAKFEMTTILNNTQPSKENSVFLDIGSGTGNLVELFRKKGYRIYGVDKSPSMVNASITQYPKCEIKCGNVENTMEFEHNTFTHILCLGFTMYNFKDKSLFFRNCYHWLMSNGYLILHVVDREKYDSTIMASKNYDIGPLNKYTNKRITDSNVDFDNINYKSEYDFAKEEVRFKETFTDRSNNKIRQNEQILYMESIQKILTIAKLCGFIIHGQVNMKPYNGDEYQYIYILEKIM